MDLSALKHGFLILLFALCSATVLGKETIRWLTWEQVPNFITKGPFKGQGLGDSLTQAIQDKLPQYNHKNLVVNASRYNRLIKKEDICVAWAWIVPGSEEYRIHSRPVSLAPQTGIYVSKEKAYKFGKAGTRLSLKTLLSNSDLRLGVLKDMPYTKKVHDLLDQYEGKPNLFMSSVKEVEFDFKMLDGNRVDYFFGFPSQAIANERIKKIKNNYQFYNIEEINLYPSMYAHCSKTPFGEKIMKALETAIDNNLLLDHLKNVEEWNGINKEYRKVFMEYVINRKEHPLVTHPEN